MRRGPDVAVRTPHRHAERMTNGPTERLVVANEPRKNRQSGGVRRRPSFRTARVGRQVEHGSRTRFPTAARCVPPRREQLEEHTPIAIDDEQVTIAAGSSTGNTAFDEIRLRPRGVRNRITVLTA